MNTVFLLMAEFGESDIPLERVAPKYFGIESKKALQKAALQQLPVPCFRAGTQKSPWLVSVHHLAKYLDEKRAEAEKEWRAMNG